MMKLAELIGHDKAQRLKTAGLHNVLAAKLASEGRPIEDPQGLRGFVEAFGTELFSKNAQYKSIVDGILALEELQKG